ncbi:hypothetical protein GLYMA_04G049951v4 [Glycine max]|nr:hypothetical protein GLYMA_04G049951v4 [Glycine max]KAH1109843.1 hypothetical protein GYH30_008974 [Glycine max]
METHHFVLPLRPFLLFFCSFHHLPQLSGCPGISNTNSHNPKLNVKDLTLF